MEFIRGKYDLDDIDYLLNIVSLMSEKEIYDIKTCEFDYLWNNLWNIDKPNKSHKSEYDTSLQKFMKLRRGVVIRFQKKIKFKLNIHNIFNNIKSEWKEPEWGFPKGRRNLKETDLNCAIREFNEETNLNSDQYNLIDMGPIIEKFIGTNGVRYQHNYYLSQINCNVIPQIDQTNQEQISEIGDMGWYSYREARKLIRDYNIDKKIKLDNIYYFIKLLLLNSNYDNDFFLEK
jgi:8-oxo-dGTP pyrophosphatase MutT (NUDIX family)